MSNGILVTEPSSLFYDRWRSWRDGLVKRLLLFIDWLLALENILEIIWDLNGIGLWWLCNYSWCVVGQYDTSARPPTPYLFMKVYCSDNYMAQGVGGG